MSKSVTIESKITITFDEDKGLQPIESKRCCGSQSNVSPSQLLSPPSLVPAAAMCTLPPCPTANGDYLLVFTKTDSGCECKAVAK